MGYCVFLATIVSLIHYESDEPLHIAYHASNYVGLCGGSIDSLMTKVFDEIEAKTTNVSINFDFISFILVVTFNY